MSFLENGKKLSFFMINEDIREWVFLKIFFPSLPNFFKHKRSLHLLGGLLDNCQTSEFMALQVSEKQEHDCLPQICTILMYFSSSHLIAVRSDAWGKAAWPQSLWKVGPVGHGSPKAGQVVILGQGDGCCLWGQSEGSATHVTCSRTGWLWEGPCSPLPSPEPHGSL